MRSDTLYEQNYEGWREGRQTERAKSVCGGLCEDREVKKRTWHGGDCVKIDVYVPAKSDSLGPNGALGSRNMMFWSVNVLPELYM